MDVDLDSYIKDKGIKYPSRGRGGNSRGSGSRGGSFRGNNNSGFGRQSFGSSGFGGRNQGGMVTKRSSLGGSFGGSSSSGPVTLHIANLDFGVSNQDIGELFGEFGSMKRFAVHFDQSGRSLGTAEVLYANSQSAMRAKNKYNGVPLDGRPMKLTVSGADQDQSRGERTSFGSRMGGGGNRSFGGGNTRGFSGGRGQSRGGAGRGRGGGRGNKPTPTLEELDAELDTLVKST